MTAQEYYELVGRTWRSSTHVDVGLVIPPRLITVSSSWLRLVQSLLFSELAIGSVMVKLPNLGCLSFWVGHLYFSIRKSIGMRVGRSIICAIDDLVGMRVNQSMTCAINEALSMRVNR